MRLYLLEPTSKLATNIARISRELRLNVVVSKLNVDRRRALRSVILVTDGTPDDIITALLSHRLNGESIVAIAKPHKTGMAAFSLIPIYLSQFRRVDKIAALMDQDDRDLNEIYCAALRLIREHGIEVETDRRKEDRLYKYECTHGGHKFELILMVNGLDVVKSRRHMIEDHLLYAAANLLGMKEIEERIEAGVDDPKGLWNALRDRHKDVYTILHNVDAGKISEIFPQHFKGLKYLK